MVRRLRPDVPIDLTVRDAQDQVLHRETLVLAAPAAREVLVRASTRLRRMWISVADVDGHPVGRAGVLCVATGTRNGTSGTTDAQGAFAFDHLMAGAVDVRVTSEAHAPLELHGVPLSPGDQEIRVVLQPACAVTLHVVDSRGEELASVPVEARCDGIEEPLRPLLPIGKPHIFRRLPCGTVRFTARLGGREYTLEHDTHAAEATLAVPAFGTIEVSLPPTEAFAGAQRIRVEGRSDPTAGSAGDPSWWTSDDGRIEHRLRFVLPGRYDVFLEKRASEDAWQVLSTWGDILVSPGATVHLDELHARDR